MYHMYGMVFMVCMVFVWYMSLLVTTVLASKFGRLMRVVDLSEGPTRQTVVLNNSFRMR